MQKSQTVGFVRLKSHAPRFHEIAADPDLAQVCRIIDEWLLIEYVCTFPPRISWRSSRRSARSP